MSLGGTTCGGRAPSPSSVRPACRPPPAASPVASAGPPPRSAPCPVPALSPVPAWVAPCPAKAWPAPGLIVRACATPDSAAPRTSGGDARSARADGSGEGRAAAAEIDDRGFPFNWSAGRRDPAGVRWGEAAGGDIGFEAGAPEEATALSPSWMAVGPGGAGDSERPRGWAAGGGGAAGVPLHASQLAAAATRVQEIIRSRAPDAPLIIDTRKSSSTPRRSSFRARGSQAIPGRRRRIDC